MFQANRDSDNRPDDTFTRSVTTTSNANAFILKMAREKKADGNETDVSNESDPDYPDEEVNITSKCPITGMQRIDKNRSYKMVNIPNRLGIRLNDNSMYFDNDAENNYKAKRATLLRYLKLQEKREEELKNSENPTPGTTTRRNKNETKPNNEIEIVKLDTKKHNALLEAEAESSVKRNKLLSSNILNFGKISALITKQLKKSVPNIKKSEIMHTYFGI